jgi:cardiolipin synthase
MRALQGAKHEIFIANAYFFPGRAFRHALIEAAQRGVKVTLLLQGHIEYWLLHRASRVLYPQLIGAGVRVIEYRKSFLHAKVAFVDEDWATVGSSNIDPFSLLLAREANVVMYGKTFSRKLKKCLNDTVAYGGVELSLEDCQRQRFWGRLLSWVAYIAVRVAMGVLGYGGRQSV